MFRSTQVITATNLTRNLSGFMKQLREQPQALLITQKNGQKLVLVNAEIFDDLYAYKLMAEHTEWPEQNLEPI